MNNSSLIIFTKNPKTGKVKTRLAKSVGEVAALKTYTFLVNHTVAITKNLKVKKTVFYSDFIDEKDVWDNATYTKQLQSGADLGLRMQNAFENELANNEKAVIIGCDCYELNQDIINEAFLKLESFDVVIGPAKDGGYYLLGLKKTNPQLFINKNWGTQTVLTETLKDLQGQKVHLLEPLNDVDTLDDIKHHPAFKHLLYTHHER